MSETDVINAFAAQYLADRDHDGTRSGASLTDCAAYAARNGDPGWLVVVCGPSPFDATRHYAYVVDHSGRLIERRGPDFWQRQGANGA